MSPGFDLPGMYTVVVHCSYLAPRRYRSAGAAVELESTQLLTAQDRVGGKGGKAEHTNQRGKRAGAKEREREREERVQGVVEERGEKREIERSC